MIYNYLSLEKVRMLKECSRITYSKSMPHPSRTMFYHDLAYVSKGHFHLCQGDDKIIAQEADVFFLTGNNYHFSDANSPKGSECIFLHFDIDEKDYITYELPSNPNEENIIAKKMCISLLLQLLVELESSVFNPNSFLGDEIVNRILSSYYFKRNCYYVWFIR
ncbi:hypothetical protein [Clostridium sp.]|uniref:hypothetical protein n=1 Tax=Clostridium sp. TaxID=1506 RepID=UPI002622D7D4|nr:hypothetical protein [uncultured Clostridium sp.]